MEEDENKPNRSSDTVSLQINHTSLLLFSLLAIFGLFLAWGAASQSKGVDFYQFWVVGQTLARPGINVYSDQDRRRLGTEFFEKAKETGNPQLISIAEYRQKLETYSSPFLYAMFRAFSTGDYDVDLRNYRLLLLASLIFSVLVLSRLLNHSWDVALGAVAIFSAWFAPFASDMRVANVNSLQLAAIAAYLCVLRFSGRYRDVFGGAILALAVAFKPNIVFIPAMLAISWIVNGRFRRVVQFAIGAVVGLAIASAMTVASFGSLRCWADWISAVRALPAEIISVEYGNFAPARMLSEWLGINVAIPAAIVFGGLALWAIQQGRQKNTTMSEPASSHDFATDGLAISLGCLLVVLVSRLAWLHYYVLMIPVILAALSPNDSLGRYPGIRHLLIGLTLFGYAFDSLRFLSLMPPPNVQSILVVVPTVILFGLTIRNAVSFNRVRGSR